MWDILITAGNVIIIPALLTTALDKRAYIPRLTSGVSLVGLTAVIVGLFGAGLVFSPIILIVIGLLWAYIFLFRHQPALPRQRPSSPRSAPPSTPTQSKSRPSSDHARPVPALDP